MRRIPIVLLSLIIIISGFSITSISDDIQFNYELSINNEYDMVILSIQDYFDYIQPLIDHKNSIGIKTLFKPIDEIYFELEGRDNAEKIKYYIKETIENYNISYVLLIGDAIDIPGRYTHVFFDEPFDYPTPEYWEFTSDFYYADIYDENGDFSSWDTNQNNVFAEYHWNGNTDEMDLTPDIYLGRLACTNSIQIETVVNKIIQYENQRPWEMDWFTNLVLISGDGIPFDPEAIDESEYLQEKIINIMDGFIPNRVWASNGGLNNAYNINDAINEGAGFVFFNGHGNYNIWATYKHQSNIMVPPGYYKTTHINELSNLMTLPIVISDACYHLQYDFHDDCFGWSFVSNPNGGSIAFIGGSDTDLAYAGTRIVEKGIEKICLKLCNLYKNGTSILGDLWGNSLIDYKPVENDVVDLLTILQNHLFGDPSLQIAGRSQPPIKPDAPQGQFEGKIKVEYEFNANTYDPDDDDLYYLFDWGDESFSNWIGPLESGELCNATHIWDNQGEYQIRVKAKDTHGMQSDWSDPLTISMPKSRFVDIFHNIFSLFDLYSILSIQI
jgi:hypothetical protein